jgi:pimeloyl-ACP methyl ester carboxylesterase
MPVFHRDDIDISYLDEGTGDPVLLIHGFASSKEVNWVQPGWVEALTKAGYRVIAFDNRGHGASTKLYDSERYHIGMMADDARALLDHLGIARADVMGYSMGARITAFLTLKTPERVRSAIFGGLAMTLIAGGGPGETVALGLEADSLSDVTEPMPRMFRAFADQTKSDRRALAACLRGSRTLMSKEEAALIKPPVLIAVGTTDPIGFGTHDLAAIIPNAEVLDIPGRDHMKAVGDRVYKSGVIDFLSRRP